MTTMFRKPTLIAASLLLAIATTSAPAQTATPAKPGAKATGKAPPKGAAKTLGGKASGGGKLMTRDELRACLKRLDDINVGAKTIDSSRQSLDAERAELQKAGDDLKVERVDVDRKLASVREWEGRVRTHATEIESYNKRNTEAPNASRAQRDALAAELKTERERLQKVRDSLTVEEATVVPPFQTAVKAYNERAAARDSKVADWNQRNGAALAEATKHEDARLSWIAECADRPYREDDEKAIKAGK